MNLIFLYGMPTLFSMRHFEPVIKIPSNKRSLCQVVYVRIRENNLLTPTVAFFQIFLWELY